MRRCNYRANLSTRRLLLSSLRSERDAVCAKRLRFSARELAIHDDEMIPRSHFRSSLFVPPLRLTRSLPRESRRRDEAISLDFTRHFRFYRRADAALRTRTRDTRQIIPGPRGGHLLFSRFF